MIFLSYNHADKQMVDAMANALASVVGRENVFYDAWSIQPGDGIIGRMSEGLSRCEIFFFFVTKNSLQSKMVTLEWQNALMKSVAGECRFVPIRADDCVMPALLRQSLHIDLVNYGFETATRQMIDVVSGRSTYRQIQDFSNLRVTATGNDHEMTVKVEAVHFLEPIARFLFTVQNQKDEVRVNIIGETMHLFGFVSDVKLDDGRVFNALSIGANRPITPRHPLIIVLKSANGSKVKLEGVMHQHSSDQYRGLPLLLQP